MWWYISSIIIYFVVFRTSAKLCAGILKQKDRIERLKKIPKMETKITMLSICCIPIIRLLVIIVLYYMSFCSDEHFDELIEQK